MGLDRARLMRQYAPRLVAALAQLQHSDVMPDEMPDDMPMGPGEDNVPAEPDQTGVMVALYLDPASAEALALDPGEGCLCCDGDACTQLDNCCNSCASDTDDTSDGTPASPAIDNEEPDELHVTLAYLGTAGVDVPDTSLDLLVNTVQAWAASQPPIDAEVSGIGLFNTEDSVVTYASVDSPALPHARQQLVTALAGAGLAITGEHGFSPHVTLAYGDARTADVPTMSLRFSTVTVAFAGQRVDIPLGAPEQAREQARGLATARPMSAPVTLPATWSPFVTTVGSRTVITAPATTSPTAMWGAPPNPNPHMLWMQGRFVGAERPNRNNALWSIADLEMGKPTVAHGPLNWLHEDRHVIGTIADAQLIPSRTGRTSADVVTDDTVPEAHITALSTIWRWLYPDEAAVVEMASESGMLAYSMECISEQVQCAGDNGCGMTFPYAEFSAGKVCAHLQDRASVRRLVRPTFLGGAVIVPPTRPGWADADASVLRQGASMVEKAYAQAGSPDIPTATWEHMMASVLTFAGVTA